MKKDVIKTAVVLAVDIGLLLLFIAFVPNLLLKTVGPDIVEYENWTGDLENATACKFGAGCMEIAIITAKLLIFLTFWLVTYLKNKKIKVFAITASLAHLVIFALGIAYIFEYAEGPNALYMITYLLTNLFSFGIFLKTT